MRGTVAHEIQGFTQDHLDGDRQQQQAQVDLENDSHKRRHQRDQRHERAEHRRNHEDESELLMQCYPIDRGDHQSGQYCSSRIALLSKPARRMIARAPLIIPG